MKRIVIIIVIWIVLGVLFAELILNNNIFKAKEYLVYAFQIGAFTEEEKAQELAKTLPSSIILKDGDVYKIYSGIYKNIDIVNKMVVYFEDKNISINLKTINTTSNFYNELENYETILQNTTDEAVFDKVNQGILDLYVESISL